MSQFLRQLLRARGVMLNALFYLLLPLVLVGIFLNDENWGKPLLFLKGYASLFVTSFSIGIAHSFVYGVIFERTRSWLQRSRLSMLFHLLAVVIATRIGIEMTAWLHAIVYGRGAVPAIRDDLTPSAYFVSAVIVATACVVMAIQESRRQAEAKVQAARQETMRAQLSALQARTDPHFLFNSLNTVAGLIEEDPRKAEQAIERLSAMFRYTLEGSRRDLVPLSEELEMATAYLENETLRFGERLRHRMSVTDEARDWPVPPLTLQPLLENAVLHGVSRRREGGQIDIDARIVGERLELSVCDDGPGSDPASNGSGGALRELGERLNLLFEEGFVLEHGPAAAGYRVRILLPRRVEA